MHKLSILTAVLFSILFSCGSDDNTPVLPGNDPNFTIVAHDDLGFTKTNKKVDVFGISIYAYSDVEDEKLLHAANVMAQYLDNDEDGIVDNQIVLDELISNNAALFMWKKESQINLDAQDLGADETRVDWHSIGNTGQFDATLEEVFHVITHSGYASAYPSIFGEGIGTDLANAMDLARGGQFTSIPDTYPASAWYTYDDQTCTYNCMATEYIYWAMTSILGAQSNRLNEISQEWKLNTNQLVQDEDPAIFELLTNPEYKFPTVLPDGTYMR